MIWEMKLSVAQKYQSDLYNYNDAYILVRNDVTVVVGNGSHDALKNCALFIKCITKIDETTIDG